MNSSILIIGVTIHHDLIKIIYKLGFLTSLINTLENAIKKIRHEKFIAIIIDRRYNISIDILEFILNIRDFNDSIPIFIIGKLNNQGEDGILLDQNKTYIVDINELTDYLNRIQVTTREI